MVFSMEVTDTETIKKEIIEPQRSGVCIEG